VQRPANARVDGWPATDHTDANWENLNPWCLKAGNWYDIMKACYENPIPMTFAMKETLENTGIRVWNDKTVVNNHGDFYTQGNLPHSGNGWDSNLRGVPAAFFHPFHFCKALEVTGYRKCTPNVDFHALGAQYCLCEDPLSAYPGWWRVFIEKEATNRDILGCYRDDGNGNYVSNGLAEDCWGGYWTGERVRVHCRLLLTASTASIASRPQV
jgi:hypothetical protein